MAVSAKAMCCGGYSRLFVQRCIDAGRVDGEGFAVDANLIQADASDRNRVEGVAALPPTAGKCAARGGFGL